MSEFSKNTIRLVAIAAAFFFFAMAAYGLIRTGILGDKIAHDYAVYWRAANQPADFVYETWQPKPFPYMPTMLLWVAPLGFVSEWAGFAFIGLVSIAALVLACRPHLPRPALVLTLMSPPLVRCVRNGQVSALLAALMLWACGTGNRIAAGVAFGVIASVKPQLVIMAPLMLALNRDWRAFFAAGASFAALILLSAVVFGFDRWPEWVGSMVHFQSEIDRFEALGIAVTPASFAERIGLNPLPFLILGAGAGGALVFACRDMGPLEKATAIATGSLLAAPYALVYDLVAIVPLMALWAMRGRLLCFVAAYGPFNPLPLVIAAFGLAYLAGRKAWPSRLTMRRLTRPTRLTSFASIHKQ
jgi:hypothetical protein